MYGHTHIHTQTCVWANTRTHMNKCAYIRMYMCMGIHTYTHKHVYVHIHVPSTYVCMGARTYTHIMCVLLHSQAHNYTPTYVHSTQGANCTWSVSEVSLHIHTYVHMYVCTYVCVHIRTHMNNTSPNCIAYTYCTVYSNHHKTEMGTYVYHL